MSKSNLKVVDRSSHERTELAAAIAAHQALTERLAAAMAADSWEKRAGLKRNVELAEAALETAKTDAAKHLTDQALGKAGDVAPTSIKEARAALQDSRDQLELAQIVESSLKTEVKKLSEDVAETKSRIESARIRLIESSPEMKSVVDRYVSLQRKLAGQRKLMEFLNVYAPAGWDVHHNPDDAEDPTAVIAEWRSAVDALAREANAALPEV
jgi:chromosome segregation ATPase